MSDREELDEGASSRIEQEEAGASNNEGKIEKSSSEVELANEESREPYMERDERAGENGFIINRNQEESAEAEKETIDNSRPESCVSNETRTVEVGRSPESWPNPAP